MTTLCQAEDNKQNSIIQGKQKIRASKRLKWDFYPILSPITTSITPKSSTEEWLVSF